MIQTNLITDQIKKQRLIKGLTQQQIAKKLEISVPTYSRIESGKTKLNFNFLKKICEALEIDYQDVLSSVIPTSSSKEIEQIKEEMLFIHEQLNRLNDLMEKQQEINKVMLEKLKKL